MKQIFIFLFSFGLSGLFAQQNHFKSFSCPVEVNGRALNSPFGGGMNAPQISPCDLNGDGVMDLVSFDRAGDRVITHLNIGTNNQKNYVFAPDYAFNFPTDLQHYALMRDYDKDGAMDIFTVGTGLWQFEIRVFKGYFKSGALNFEPVKFHYPNCTSCDASVIFYPDETPGFWNNLSVANSDVPAFDDIDGDGDLDLVSFEAAIGGHTWYWKNKSVEKGFGLDSLHFELEDRCWGGYYESGLVACENELSCHPDSCAPCGGVPSPTSENLHPGSTVTTYDKDGDGDKEVILGDINFACLNEMTNGGSINNAWMTEQDVAFPSYDVSAEVITFPAAYMLEGDNATIQDMVVAPNQKNIQEDRFGVWYYKNTGTSSAYDFTFQENDFLVGEMIDIGTGAHPALADVNADGLLDLVIGSFGFYKSGVATNARLYLYLNTGSGQNPSFELVDDDWLEFERFAPDDYDFVPVFEDLDSDGDLDLVVGGFSGTMYFMENIVGPGSPMKFTDANAGKNWFTIDVGKSSVPAFKDLDGDGVKDMLVGEANGNFNFFKNLGSVTQADFASLPDDKDYGNFKTTTPPGIFGYSTPVFYEDGNCSSLVTGQFKGKINVLGDYFTSSDTFKVLDAWYGGVDVGERSHPAFGDLNGDGIPEMVVGNQRGGIEIYQANPNPCLMTSIFEKPKKASFDLTLSPNPTEGLTRVEVSEKNIELHWKLYNQLGQIVQSGNTSEAVFNIDLSSLPSANYWLSVQSEMGQSVRQVSKK